MSIIAGACATQCPVVSLLILTLLECPLPRIPVKEMTERPLWCESRLFISFAASYVFHSLYQVSAHNLSSATSFLFYSLAAASSITQGL
ncbi:hypothetical protein B0H13DRAFT_1977569, partial [Mycena leptocephala]